MQGSAGGKGRETRKRDGELIGEALWAFFPLSDLPRDSWGTHTAGPGKADPHLKQVRLGEGENPEKRLFQAEASNPQALSLVSLPLPCATVSNGA